MIESCPQHEKEVICIVNHPMYKLDSILKCQECLTERNYWSNKLVFLNDLNDISQPISWPSLEFYSYQKELKSLDDMGINIMNDLKVVLQEHKTLRGDSRLFIIQYYQFLEDVMNELKRQREWFDNLGIKSHIKDILFSSILDSSEKNENLKILLCKDQAKLSKIEEQRERNQEIRQILSLKLSGDVKNMQKLFQQKSINLLKTFKNDKKKVYSQPVQVFQSISSEEIQKQEDCSVNHQQPVVADFRFLNLQILQNASLQNH